MKTITVEALATIVSPTLIDVREPDEFAAAHAEGAVNVPLASVESANLPSGTTLYVICQSGGRSARAVAALTTLGLDAVNVEGGTTAWLQAGLPAVAGR